MLRLTNKKGNASTIRQVREDNNALVNILGTVKDMLAADLLLGEYPESCMDKWLLMGLTDEYDVKEFDSKEAIKQYLGIK